MSKDWKCSVCDISNYDNRENCVNCGSPKEIICKDCGSKFIFSKFLQCFYCPICTGHKINPKLVEIMQKCPTCGGQKASIKATCDNCENLAQLLINQYGAIGPKKLFEMMKEKNNYG